MFQPGIELSGSTTRNGLNQFVSRQDTGGPRKREIEEGQVETNSLKMQRLEELCKELKVTNPAN